MAIKTVSINATQLDGYKMEARVGQHIAIVDQPVSGGGTDSGPSPLDYLLISLAGCIVTIGHIIARQRRIPIKNIEVRVEGDIDTDVLMGKKSDSRSGFSAIRVVTNIDADMSLEEKKSFLHEIDLRCPISDNINNLTPIEFLVE